MTGEPETPPPRPRGGRWTAKRPADLPDEDELDLTVSGNVIRFMWDFGVRVPLWDGDGLVSDEPAWLRAALGLSDSLIEELTDWGSAMDHLDADPSQRTDQAYRDLDRRARELVERLRHELGPRFTVTYVAW